MLELLNDRARMATIFGQRAARRMGSDAVMPVHLMLGIAEVSDRFAARAMRFYGMTQEAVQGKLSVSLAPAEPASHELPYARASFRVLERSRREALFLGERYIAPQHLLFGLLWINDAGVNELLRAFNVDAAMLRLRTLELMDSSRI